MFTKGTLGTRIADKALAAVAFCAGLIAAIPVALVLAAFFIA